MIFFQTVMAFELHYVAAFLHHMSAEVPLNPSPAGSCELRLTPETHIFKLFNCFIF